MGRRTVAAVIDMVLLAGLFVLMSALSGSIHSSSGSFSIRLTGWTYVLYLLLCFGYFIVFEWLLAGTIGKLILGLRVAGDGGERLSLGRSLARNLMRAVDGFPYVLPYLLGFVVAMAGMERRRLGDKVAGASVIAR